MALVEVEGERNAVGLAVGSRLLRRRALPPSVSASPFVSGASAAREKEGGSWGGLGWGG